PIFCVGDEGQIAGRRLFQTRDAHDVDVAVPLETTLKPISDVAQFQASLWQDGEYNMRLRVEKPRYTRGSPQPISCPRRLRFRRTIRSADAGHRGLKALRLMRR